MRFMIIAKATKESDAGVLPKPEAFVAMQKYNEELVKAGILLAAEGLTASRNGFAKQLDVRRLRAHLRMTTKPERHRGKAVLTIWHPQGFSSEDFPLLSPDSTGLVRP
jgi:hypothetical protein